MPAPFGAALAIACAVVSYWPALRNGFVWDDPLVLEQMRAVRTWWDLLVLPPELPRIYYRPVIFATYLVDRALGGGHPFWFHLSVIIAHAINSALVFALARRLFGGEVAIPTTAAVLFAVWPAHVESVAWMAGRSDVIACAFLLTAVWLGGSRRPIWTAWAGGLALFLALLSKELAIAGLVLVPALDWLETRRAYWTRYVPLVLAVLGYALLRQHGAGALIGGEPVAAAWDRLARELVSAVGFYAIRSVAPVGLSAYIPAVPDGPLYVTAGVVLPLAVGLLLARGWPRTRWPLAFLAVWFVVTLAPSFTVILRRSASAPVADRYLYVPSVASCTALAWAIDAAARRTRLAASWWPLAVVAILTVGLSVGTATYARVWANNDTFWTAVARTSPDSAFAQRELGTALLERGQLDEAERALRQALARSADATGTAMAYSNLGLVYRRQMRMAEAIAAFESALQIAPHPGLYHNLGLALMAKAEQDQRRDPNADVLPDVRRARDAFTSALAAEGAPVDQRILVEHWDPAKTHALLGQVLIALGDPAGARLHLEAALRLQPTGPVADVTRRQLERLER